MKFIQKLSFAAGFKQENVEQNSTRVETKEIFGCSQAQTRPTCMRACAIQHPADTEREAACGEIGEIPSKMFATFTEMFSSAAAPDPHEVASAIAALIDQPKAGARLARSWASHSAPMFVNLATDPVQHGVVAALGFGHLETLRPAPNEILARIAAKLEGRQRQALNE